MAYSSGSGHYGEMQGSAGGLKHFITPFTPSGPNETLQNELWDAHIMVDVMKCDDKAKILEIRGTNEYVAKARQYLFRKFRGWKIVSTTRNTP